MWISSFKSAREEGERMEGGGEEERRGGET